MKTFLFIITFFISAPLLIAQNFAMQSVWQNVQYETGLNESLIKTKSWDHGEKVPVSMEESLALCKSEFSNFKGLKIGQLSEISLSNYRTIDKPLWLWKIAFRNGKEGEIETAGGKFKDKDKLVFFVDMNGILYKPTKR